MASSGIISTLQHPSDSSRENKVCISRSRPAAPACPNRDRVSCDNHPSAMVHFGCDRTSPGVRALSGQRGGLSEALAQLSRVVSGQTQAFQNFVWDIQVNAPNRELSGRGVVGRLNVSKNCSGSFVLMPAEPQESADSMRAKNRTLSFPTAQMHIWRDILVVHG